jgi:hypothetical protein
LQETTRRRSPTDEEIAKWRKDWIAREELKEAQAAKNQRVHGPFENRSSDIESFPDDDLDEAWEQHREEKVAKPLSGSGQDWIEDFKTMDWLEEDEKEPWKPPEEEVLIPNESTHEFGERQTPPAAVPKAPPAAVQPTPAEVVEEAIREASNQRELRQDCPSFWTNKALANCPEIRNDTELKAIGLLNTLMKKHGYAYVSNEQFAVYMKMDNSESTRHLLARLAKRGLIKNTDKQRNRIKWVVRKDLQNPRRGGSKAN